MKYTLLLLLLAIFTIPQQLGAASASEAIALYQADTKIEQQQQEVAFWEQRLATAPQQWMFQVKLAGAHSGLFELTADIKALKTAENLLLQALAQQPQDPSSIQRTLAHNYISQHRFCEALDLVLAAYHNGSGQRASELMLFDIYAELGDETEQIRLLEKLRDDTDFDYLIRLAKWEDSQGQLDRTITLMETAKDLAERSQQQALIHWTYSNLADYYGHAGAIETSRKYYQRSLTLNPADWYSMKGLAWILYSHDDQPEEALRILAYIDQFSQDPGIQLLKAEIMAYLGNDDKAEQIHRSVAQTVSQPAYGPMYHAFLVEHYSQQPQLMEQALQLAHQEVSERPVPASYSLLIQALFAQGNLVRAQQLSREKIWQQTYEPGILVQQFQYFKGLKTPYLQEVAQELQEARFELGPVVYQEVPASIN